MNSFKTLFLSDCKRYPNGKIPKYQKRLLFWFRKCQTTKNGFLNLWNRFRFRCLANKHAIEISSRQIIGKGLYLGHPYNITINDKVVIGSNCNIHRGVAIGQENRGKRKGTPTIGDNVWIGINAIIVGNITIGNDVLIAPNSFVNCDVPSHSVVFGNPCIIKHKEGATNGYINNVVDGD